MLGEQWLIRILTNNASYRLSMNKVFLHLDITLRDEDIAKLSIVQFGVYVLVVSQKYEAGLIPNYGIVLSICILEDPVQEFLCLNITLLLLVDISIGPI